MIDGKKFKRWSHFVRKSRACTLSILFLLTVFVLQLSSTCVLVVHMDKYNLFL